MYHTDHNTPGISTYRNQPVHRPRGEHSALVTPVLDKLMDVLTASEVTLILTTLDVRQQELTRRAEDARQFAATEHVDSDNRRRLHLSWAADDQHRADAINALLAKLRG